MSAAVPFRCMATQPTPHSAAIGHSVPDTSLTSPAPAATAARATPAFTVSTDTRPRGGTGAPRLPAHVDHVGTLAEHGPTPRDRGAGRLVAAAVEEGVRGDVEHTHHQWVTLIWTGHIRIVGDATPAEGGRWAGIPRYRPCTNCIASARVAWSLRNRPRTAEVTVWVPGFFTPRMDMHRCSASTTTRTPRGSSAASMASAISVVIRSWTWRRRA